MPIKELRHNIRSTLLSVSIVPLCLMGLLAVVLVWQFDSLVSTSLQVAHTDRVIANSYQMQKLLLDMETGIRGYLVTRNPIFLERYTATKPYIAPSLNELRKSVLDNPAQVSRIDSIHSIYKEWEAYTVRMTEVEKAQNGERSHPNIEEGKRMMDEMRAQITAIIQTEQQQHKERSQATERAIVIAAGIGIGLTALMGITFTVFFRRRLTYIANTYEKTLETVKKQGDEIRENEERYRSLVEVSPDSILVVKGGKVTFANSQGLKMFGAKDLSELLGKSPYELVHLDDREITEERIRTLLDQNMPVPPMEQKAIRLDGSVVEIEAVAAPFWDKGERAILAVIHDITLRKALEKSLRESEEHFRMLVEDVKDYSLFIIDKDGCVVSWNLGAERIKGYKTDEILGKHFSCFFSEADVKSGKPQRFISLAGENGVHEEECWLVRKDGSSFRASIVITALRNGNNADVRGFTNVIRDVTERRLLEEQLQQSNKMEAIGRLASGVAHDFNNLLTAIIGNAQLALYRSDENDITRPHLEEIDKASEKAAALTRQLLMFSRKQILQLRVVDMNLIVEDVQKILSRLIGEDIELIVHYAPTPSNIKADPGQIEQIIMNLAVNARDAMPEGGKLIIEVNHVYLDKEYTRTHIDVLPGHYVMLVMTDTGMGMDKETLKHIFEPFFSTKDVGKGTGLGLATTYGIVKQSEGDIWVYSEVGRGTTFKIYFPQVSDSAEHLVYSALEGSASPLGTETILLAEDDDGLRELLTEVLREKGYNVLPASGAKAAMSINESFTDTIHLLLTDVVMPELRGNMLAEELKKHRPDMKVLFMSGYTDETMLHQGVFERSENYIQKPFAPWTIIQKVRDVLDG